MINKEYWDNFYKLNLAPNSESDFAKCTSEHIQKNGLEALKLIDVACGNGRDTFFFARNGIKSTGIDLSVVPKAEDPEFLKEDILDFNYSDYGLIYMRFIVHALKEEELDRLIENIAHIGDTHVIFIETRSSKGITNEDRSETYFRSSIGEEHFRMLYSEKYLTEKLSRSFDVEKVEENTGFSVFKGEDPVCIRYILRTK